MAKAGRKPTPTDVLERRGSWRAKRRKKDERAAQEPQPLKYDIPKPPKDARLHAIILKVPGYDPRKGAREYRFDRDLARKAIMFFHGKLRHVKGEMAGRPFILETWEQAIIANLFGWVHKKTGLRRYRQCFIEIPRKNGKTVLAAGILLYLLFEDGEPGAEIYGAASKYDQASLVWTHAAGMVRQCPELAERAHIFKGQAKCIESGVPGDPDYATYRVISSDSLGSHGFNIHGAVIDELHAFASGDLVDTLTTGTGSRRQPLIVYITTRDYDRISACNEKEAYAGLVRDRPESDPTFLPVLYQTPEDADWKNPEIWKKANPNYGVSIKPDFLAAECRKAIEVPRLENVFKRLYLDMKTQQEVRWLPIEDWKACVEVMAADWSSELSGRPCVIGMDLSSNRDITATCVLFPPQEDSEPYRAMWKLYVPADNIEARVRQDKVPYDLWARQGHITATPGNTVDYARIREDLYAISEQYSVQMVVFDRWGFEALRQQMIGEGMPEELFVSFGQGFASMSPAMKALERFVLSRRLLIQDNPAILWMAANVAVKTDPAGNIKPTKEGSGERIDGIVALIEAVGAAITRNLEDNPLADEVVLTL